MWESFVMMIFLLYLLKRPQKSNRSKVLIRKDIEPVTPYTSPVNAFSMMIENNVSILPVVENNEVIGVVKLEDVSKVVLSRLNELEADNAELSQQLEFKEDYIGIVTHDIQTPLHVISLSCDFLLSREDSFSDEERNFLERISRNSDNAMNIVENVLRYAKVESGFNVATRQHPLTMF